MKVKCINDNFLDSDSPVVKKILLVGDDHLLPKLNQEYEILGYGNFGGKKTYKLDLPSSLDAGYTHELWFTRNRFEISDDTFIPNGIINGVLCRKVLMIIEMNVDDRLSEAGIWVHQSEIQENVN